MKTIKIFCLVIVSSMIFSLSYANEKVLIYTSDYEPYYGEKMTDFGPVAKITVLALKEAGYDSEIKLRPWARCLKKAQIGKCDILIAVWYSAKRENWMAFTDPILVNENGIYKRKSDNLVFTNCNELIKNNNVVVGSVRGYVLPECFRQEGLVVENVTTDLMNMRKLVAGRIRLALVDKYVGFHLLKNEGMENEIEWLATLVENPLRIGIMKNAKGDWKTRLENFNKALAKLKSRGDVEKILKQLPHHIFRKLRGIAWHTI